MPTANPGPNRFDAVLFDMDGTLVDSAAEISASLAFAFAEIGVTPAMPVERLVDGSPLEEVFATAAPGAPAGAFARFIESYRRHYVDAHAGRTRTFPGVEETLSVLSALRPSLRLALVTARRGALAEILLRDAGLRDHFDRVIGTGESQFRPKPAPDAFLAVAADLGVAPARTLVVGDTVRDVQAARAAGMAVAVVTYGLGAPEDLRRAAPDYVLEEIDEVTVLLGLAE